MKLQHRQKRSGYTLLELLVVMAIIAILATVGLVSFNATQKKSRDTRRKGDLRSISNALEQYYAVCGSIYPTPATGSKVPSTVFCPSPSQAMMVTVPNDPGTNVAYGMTGAGTSYSICAPNTPPLEAEATTPYCLTNQQ